MFEEMVKYEQISISYGYTRNMLGLYVCFEINDGIDAQCSVVSGDEYNGFFRRIECAGGYCQSKPNWCPLKEIPEEEHDTYYEMDEYCEGYNNGWNAFRGRILGENKDV